MGNAPQDEIRARHYGQDEPVQPLRREGHGIDAGNAKLRPRKVEAVLTARDLGPGEDDDIEYLREDQGCDGEVDIAQAGGEIGHETRDHGRATEPIKDGKPKVWGLHRD